MESDTQYIITNACPEDYGNIKKLFYSIKTEYFGRHRKTATQEDIFHIDYKTHRILIPVSIAKHVIIGYAEVSNAPHIPALTGDLWMDFIKFHYCCNLNLSATNTCFLNTFVYNVDYIPEMLKQLLSEIFYREDNLKFIIVLESPDYRIYPEKDQQNYYCLEGISTVFYPKCFSALTCTNTQKLHVFFRIETLSQIRYRKALPEDNDDLVDISNQDNSELKEQMGEYYIAEELLSETNICLIVTEIKNVTAGFIWLSEDIGVLLLLENYYLQAFGNLLKFNPKERFKEKMLLVNSAQKSNLDKCFVAETINDVYICAFEETLLDYASNLSLYSRVELDDEIGSSMQITRTSIMFRWEELDEKLKSYSYYTQVHKRHIAVFYNISDVDSDAPWDARINAFAIQLFGLMEQHDPRRVFRLLSTSFTAYPDKDYCLLSIKAGQKTTPVLSEFLKYFIPVIFRPNCDVTEHLFITHRCAVNGEISLFTARESDETSIINLLKQEPGHMYPSLKRARSRISTIANRISVRSIHLLDTDSFEESIPTPDDVIHVRALLRNIFEDPFSVYKCFTIRCGDSTRPIDDNTIVGFVIIRPFTLCSFLQKHFYIYNTNEFQNFHKAEIIILKLHDFFHFQADFIFRELGRQTDFYYFYYFNPTDRNHNYNDLIHNMQPVEPRRVKKLWFNYLGQSEFNSYHVSKNEFTDFTMDLLYDHFAVFTTNLKPSTNFGSSKNIVILGFTDICKALLRLLIFTWHALRKDLHSAYNCLPNLNITVICNPGIMEADHEHGFQCKTCPKGTAKNCWVNFKNSDAFVRDVCERLDVRTWIRFVSGKVKSIDRERHLIIMESQCEIFYEILLLMCGTDFGKPKTLFRNIERPPNYSHFNNRFDKILFYHKLKMLQNNLSKRLRKSIVVYGCHLRTYEFINFLLQHDVKGSEIHLVIPRSRKLLQMGLMLNNSAEDTRIEEILREMVEDLGVQTYDFMNIERIKLLEDGKTLKDIILRKHITHEEITLQCDLFVSFYENFLPDALLKTANIETDNDFVLVDENYETSAHNVFAMGNFIKFKKETNYQYRFVSPQEAAEKIVKNFGLINSEQIETKFSKSSYFQAQLPMDYLVVKVTTPKRYLANHLGNEYGFPLVTYYEGEFSRVRLNDRGMVEEIVIVTKKKINYDFLKFFCGHHELLLNNLKSRWYLREIVNFIDFFQEPWTELLMHDDFETLRKHNANLVKDTAIEVAQKNMDRDDRRKLFYGHCQDLGITAQIEFAFLEFIRNHRNEFSTDIALPEDFARRSKKV